MSPPADGQAVDAPVVVVDALSVVGDHALGDWIVAREFTPEELQQALLDRSVRHPFHAAGDDEIPRVAIGLIGEPAASLCAQMHRHAVAFTGLVACVGLW